MQNLTEKETKLMERLIQLGDSKELAIKTVIAERERRVKMEAAHEDYRLAYTS